MRNVAIVVENFLSGNGMSELDRVVSPDPFEDDEDEKDSFDEPIGVTLVDSEQSYRKRSLRMVVEEEDEADDSFDRSVDDSKIDIANRIETGDSFVVDNRENGNVSMIKESSKSGELHDDSLSRLLEDSTDDEQDVNDDLCASTSNNCSPSKISPLINKESGRDDTRNSNLNESFDVFEENNARLLPVHLPHEAHSRRKDLPMSSDGPCVVIGSDTGEYWNQQQQTIEFNGDKYDINSFNDYMRLKISKLNHQVNIENSKSTKRISSIFCGYSVFVNGHTEPPALVIRDLIISHGGEYHCYYIHGKTTYVICSSLASAKIDKVREKEIFIKADWITESISAGVALPYEEFLIYEKNAQQKGFMEKYLQNNDKRNCNDETKYADLDARNPNFIKNYYARSRLHLISTLAQEMKDFVANMKMKIIDRPQKCFDEVELMDLSDADVMGKEEIVFHVDLDCFFVSVGLRDKPELIDQPVAITHSKGTSSNSMSEIASCSYSARSCGVHNGMLVRDALQCCPRLVLLPYQFDDYANVSRKIYEILASYTLDIRAVSCDEMYVNATALCLKYNVGDATKLAEHIRTVIKRETGCTASIGIGSTSFRARLATRKAKPDGVYWLRESLVNEFMKSVKVKDLPGVGYQMMEKLHSLYGNLSNCADLQQLDSGQLEKCFGAKLGLKIFGQCRGDQEDPKDFWESQIRKSVSCDINYGIRFTKRQEMINLMASIGKELESKLNNCFMMAQSITLKLMIRSADAPIETAKFMGHGKCDTFTKTCHLTIPTRRASTITEEAIKLYNNICPNITDLRGVGITCSKLQSKSRKDLADVVKEMFSVKSSNNEMKREKVTNLKYNEIEEDMRHVIENGFPDEPTTSAAANNYEEIELIPSENVTIPDWLKNIKGRRLKRAIEIHKIPFDDYNQLEMYLKGLCKAELEQKHVIELYQFLERLVTAGKIESLVKVMKMFMNISMNRTLAHIAWFEVYHLMAHSLNNLLKMVFEFEIDFNRIDDEEEVPDEQRPHKKNKIDNTHLVRRIKKFRVDEDTSSITRK